MSALPLSGISILDLTRVLAGPTCARTLAQYGADALVISSPNLPSVPYFVTDTGHGKRAAFIDLASDHGRAVLRELVRSGDVFSQGYRQGALERHGFGPVELAALRPGIIVTAINCYGHEGDILRYVFSYSIALAALVGIMVTLQAYVFPFTRLVIR